jgi:methylmalonyl-CoA carboxyltransferase 12S subunit
LGRLASRVAALEEVHAPPSVAAPATAPVAARPEGLGEEVLLVLGAAIAAYLGKSAHIRQVRLIGSTAWAQQGRVTIQASHALSVQHG